MGAILPRFDRIVLLTAPDALLVERLAARVAGSHGCRPEEVARVLGLVRAVEPRLRKIASHVIDTSGPIDETLARILELA